MPAYVLRRPDGSLHAAGVIPMVIGGMLLLWCVRDFYVAGKGTVAPWDPPKRLVVVGLYRYSRNPIYIAVLIILIGWALTLGSRAHALYALAMAMAFHLRVVYFEEPYLARQHGDEWTQYRASVPRWFG